MLLCLDLELLELDTSASVAARKTLRGRVQAPSIPEERGLPVVGPMLQGEICEGSTTASCLLSCERDVGDGLAVFLLVLRRVEQTDSVVLGLVKEALVSVECLL